MGKGGGGTTTTSSNQPPPEVLAQYKQLIGQANSVAGNPLQQYGGPMIAGFTPDQEAAFSTIRGAPGLSSPYLGNAENLINQSNQNLWNGVEQFTPQNLNKYMDPYMNQVVDATMANINETNAQQQQGVMGDAISKGAWGGDRAGIAQAELARQQGLASNQTLAGLRSQGFGQGLQQFNQQQGAQLGANTTNSWLASQGAFGMANLGNQAFNTAMTGANAQLGTGQLQQQQAQSALNIPYEQFIQQQAFPYQNLSWLSGISTGLGSNSGGTSSTTQPGPSGASQAVGTALGLAGMIFSDRRLKKDVSRVGEFKGFPLYNYKYKGDDTHQIGLMAQDVEKRKPEAVGESRGFKYIDYDKLARGGAVPGMPRGFLPEDEDMIPNAGMSFIPSNIEMAHGTGIPTPPPPTEQKDPAAQGMGMAQQFNGSDKKSGDSPIWGALKDKFGGSSVRPSWIPETVGTADLPWKKPNFTFGEGLHSMFMGFAPGGAIPGMPPGMAPLTAEEQMKMMADLGLQGNSGLDPLFDLPEDQYAADTGAMTKPTGLGGPPPPPQPVQPAAAPFSPGLTADNYAPMPDTSKMTQAEPINKPDPWQALAAAGFAMAAGTSPHAMSNIGAGALYGLKDYQSQKDRAAKEINQQATVQEHAQKLLDDANEWRNKLAQEGDYKDRALAEETDYHKNYIDVLKQKNSATVGDMGAIIPPLGPDGIQIGGKDYLSYLSDVDPAVATIAEAIANGDSPWPTGYALRNPTMKQALVAAKHIDPTANGRRFTNIQKFDTGKQGDLTRSFNVVADHLGTLENAAMALDNGDVKALNMIKNTFKEQFGSELPSNVNTAKQMVSAEIVKAITGAGGVADRQELKDSFNAAKSEDQWIGALTVAKHLVGGQLKGLEQQYKATTGASNYREKYLAPGTITYIGLEEPAVVDPAAAPAAGGAAPATPQAAPGDVHVPKTVPPGAQYSPSRKQFRGPKGELYDMNGNPI